MDGSLLFADMRVDPHFGFLVPKNVSGVPNEILNPRGTWENVEEYDLQAQKLVDMFLENFKTFEAYVSEDVLNASPKQIVSSMYSA